MRASFRVIAGLALGLVLASCGQSAQDAAVDDRTITVGIIGGSWTTRVDDAVAARMKAAGIKVRYVQGNAQQLKPKLIAARGRTPPLDLIELDDQSYGELRRGGFLEPYDAAAMPNLAKVHPAYKDGWQVAYWVNVPALVYNIDKLKAAGITPPRRFSDLADPRLGGHVLLSDLSHYMGYYGLVALALENGGNERNPQPGFDALARIRPHSYFTSSATTAQLWRSGDIWAALAVANEATRLKEAGVNVAVVQPPVGAHPIMVVRGSFALTKGSTKKAAAQAFIDATLAAEAQKAFYYGSGVLPSNIDALRDIRANPRKPEVPFIGTRDEDIAQAYIPKFEEIDPRDWNARFQKSLDRQPR